MPDGRRVGVYWLIDNTMQRTESSDKLPGKNWDGAESLPVEFRLVKQSDGYRLAVSPAAEVYDLLADGPVWSAGGSTPVTVTEDGLELYPDGDCSLVYVKLKFRGAGASRLALEILKRGDESAVLNYSFSGERLTVVRSGRTAAVPRDNMFMSAPADEEGCVTLEIFIDRSAVAIFDTQGHTAQGLVFTSAAGKAGLALSTRLGNAELLSAEVYELTEMRAEPEATPENNTGKFAKTKMQSGLTAGMTAAIIIALVLLAAGVTAAIIILNKKR
jgi:sucrose-6-phosphate hydrolase SacC (GH32 family)